MILMGSRARKILPLFVLFPDHLHVRPHIPLELRVAQEEGGVVGGHKPGALVCIELAPRSHLGFSLPNPRFEAGLLDVFGCCAQYS